MRERKLSKHQAMYDPRVVKSGSDADYESLLPNIARDPGGKRSQDIREISLPGVVDDLASSVWIEGTTKIAASSFGLSHVQVGYLQQGYLLVYPLFF